MVLFPPWSKPQYGLIPPRELYGTIPLLDNMGLFPLPEYGTIPPHHIRFLRLAQQIFLEKVHGF